MQALELLRLAKHTSHDEAMLNIKPIALAVIELRLSEGIHQSVSWLVSWLVSQSVENSSK